ncbi:jacalin-like lectin [uncultured Shewanella sp.]|uniref:jacalin-like lectin n=1 Tax=uncultured Shewanella sp. TaxID=173975 RepID=UPI00261EC8F0|nr:jacalin-like lectin [uncultured Shewanella sp.]
MRQLTSIALMTCSIFASPLSFADDTNDVTDYLDFIYDGMIVGSSSGDSYDTTDGIDDIPGNKISNITLYYNDSIIQGMQVDYLYGASETVGSNSGSNTESISLDDSEFVTYAVVNYSDSDTHSICGLTFTTSDDNTLKVKQCSDTYSSAAYKFYDGSERVMTGLYGTADDSGINTLSFTYAYPLELELTNVDYDTDIDIGSATTAFLSSSVGINATSESQSMDLSVTYSETDSSTDSYSSTAGITEKMDVSVSVTEKAEAIVSVSASWEYSLSLSIAYSETVGVSKTESTTTSYTESSEMTVPAMSIYAMKKTVYSSTANFPYTLTYTNPWDSKEFYVYGNIDNATAVTSYVEWLEIGYVDDDGSYVVYDDYQSDYGDIIPTSSSSVSSLTCSSSSISSLSTSTVSLNELNVDSLNISLDDPNWQMSDEEIQFRQENGITD